MDGPTSITPRLEDALMSGIALLPAGANVVLQLARVPVGRAVASSPVASGSLTRHPLKRTRTTLAFLALALTGTDEERRRIRREIDRSHRPVRSRPGDEVPYSAFDPELQGWVAACLYQGARQAVVLSGIAVEEVDDELYRIAERLGTTLQVPADWWPADRAAFAEYWREHLAECRFDDVTGPYLRSFVALDFLPLGLGRVLGPLHALLVGHFLAPELREGLGIPWDARRARRADRLVTVVARGWRRLPRALRHAPLNLVLYDTRRRLARGRPVV